MKKNERGAAVFLSRYWSGLDQGFGCVVYTSVPEPWMHPGSESFRGFFAVVPKVDHPNLNPNAMG